MAQPDDRTVSGLRNTATCNNTPVALSMGIIRGEGLSGTRSNVVTSPGGSTSRLDEEFPCVRRCVGYSNRKRPNAADRAEMVPIGVLRQP